MHPDRRRTRRARTLGGRPNHDPNLTENPFTYQFVCCHSLHVPYTFPLEAALQTEHDRPDRQLHRAEIGSGTS